MQKIRQNLGFDTIKFQLENLHYYDDLGVNFLHGEKISVGGLKFVRLPTDEFGVFKEMEFSKAKLTSQSYVINFNINSTTKVGTWEFSIPKYYYRHNVYHFPQQSGSEHHDLMIFIHHFFLNEYRCDIRWTDLKIVRLDICYNYVFQSPDNRDVMFNEVKKIFESRFDRGKVQPYGNESIMYHTQNWSFKMYKKGDEFMKNDYYNLIKNDPLPTKMIDEIALQAHKTLRFEMTLRKRKITANFFENIEKTSQASNGFKIRLKNAKHHYNKAKNILEFIVRKLNKYVQNPDITYYETKVALDRYVNNRNNHYHQYCRLGPDGILLTAKKIKESPNLLDFKLFRLDNVTNLLTAEHKENKSRYLKYIAPKDSYAEIDELQRKYNAAYNPEVLIFDDCQLQFAMNQFREIFESLNVKKGDPITPLQALNKYATDLKKANYKVVGLKSFLKMRKVMTDSEIAEVKSKKTVQRNKSLIEKINKYLNNLYPDQNISLYSATIPEEMQIF